MISRSLRSSPPPGEDLRPVGEGPCHGQALAVRPWHSGGHAQDGALVAAEAARVTVASEKVLDDVRPVAVSVGDTCCGDVFPVVVR